MKKTPLKTARTAAQVASDVEAGLAWLKSKGSQRGRDSMARYGLPSDHAVGVSVKEIQALAKRLGRDHALTEAFWASGVYEARLLVAYVGEPARLTPAEMERWCRDFDNWGVVDTLCFVLFDQSPHAWDKVGPWAKKKDEFQCRAGYVLLACLAAHDESAEDARFRKFLPLIEQGAADERNFVKKGVSWALRMIGRRNLALNKAALDVARRLADSEAPAARWIGKGAVKELTSPAVVRRIAAKDAKR